jgi:hypothetical protein
VQPLNSSFVRHLVLDVLPNADINKTCFLVSGKYFSSYTVSEYYRNRTQAELRTPT